MSTRSRVVVAVAAAASSIVLLAHGCGKAELRRVSDNVYVAESVPGLQRAAEKISKARAEKESAATSVAPAARDLSVSVRPGTGLGPESFRVAVDERSIRVEGGDAAGALYGALAMARWIRQGREPRSIPEVRPRFPLRIVDSELEPPLPGDAPPVAWNDVLDRMAAARWNTLVLKLRNRLPSLIVLERYPRSFDGSAGKPGEARGAMLDLLREARERNVAIVLVLDRLELPASFKVRYGGGDPGLTIGSPLGRSFVSECVAELLRTYPGLAGIGIGSRSLEGVPADQRPDFVRAVAGNALRAAGRGAYLFIDRDAARALGDLSMPPEVPLVVEADGDPVPDEVRGQLVAKPRPGRRACAALSFHTATPCLPGLSGSRRVLADAGASMPDGLVLRAFGSPSPSEYLRRRDALVAMTFGLSAFDPPLDDEARTHVWTTVLGSDAGQLAEAADRLASAWISLRDFHVPERGWDPLTATERGREPGGLRDSEPFVSILEFAFSGTGSATHLSIPDLVSRELRGLPADPALVGPLDVAGALLDAARATLERVEAWTRSRESTGAAGEASGWAAMELAGAAHVAEFHGRRIRAALALLRHAAGIGDEGRGPAHDETRAAIDAWKRAAETYGDLARGVGVLGDFPPDLARLVPRVEDDLRLVEAVRQDPVGFRLSPLAAGSTAGRTTDLRALRGFLDLGPGILDLARLRGMAGGQHVELEDFVTNWLPETGIPGHSGDGYVSSGIDGVEAPLPATIRVNQSRSGKRYFWIRALCGGGGSPLTIALSANGTELRRTHATTAGPLRFAWEQAGAAELPEGDSVLQIVDAGCGKEGVDALVITDDAEWTPPAF